MTKWTPAHIIDSLKWTSKYGFIIKMMQHHRRHKCLRPCVFSKKFVFASFGNWLFSNFRNISVMSEPSELVPTRKPTRKSRFFMFFVFASFGKKFRKKLRSTRPVSTHKNSSRLKNWLESLVKSSECRALQMPSCHIQFNTWAIIAKVYTIKLGYINHGYKKFTVYNITNKIMSHFWS